MPDPITVLVALFSLLLGWGLKTVTDAWTWRRQQVLDSYGDLLQSVDHFSLLVTRVWREGRDMTKRTPEWVAIGEEARDLLAAVDRADGKLKLVSRWDGALISLDLYIACERMFRRSIAVPPAASERFHEASMEMVKRYDGVVEQGRSEMGLRHWRERLPRRKSLFEITEDRLTDLDRTDPVALKKPAPGAGPTP